MSALIKALGLATGEAFNRPLWLKSYDVDSAPPEHRSSHFAGGGDVVINGAFGGKIVLTSFREDAQRFESNVEAMMAWNTISKRRPMRPDGRPNKPLTALTVEVEPL